MDKKWLCFFAAAVIVAASGCKGEDTGNKTVPFAEESQEKDTQEGPSADSGVKESTEEKESGESSESGISKRDPGEGEEKPADTESTGEENDEDMDTGNEAGQGYGDFQTGTWEGLTFTNQWLGLTITFPEGSNMFSGEDMRKLVGESDEILVNTGDYEEIQDMVSEASNIYDFMVTMPDGKSSVQMAYMNAEKVAPGQEISGADCLEEMAGELSAIKDMGYEISGIEKRNLGEQTFDGFSASLMEGALYQEYYARRIGDFVAVMTITYTAEEKEAVEDMLRGIKAASDNSI